jgi:DNA-binding MarR family transcriptional regulator
VRTPRPEWIVAQAHNAGMPTKKPDPNAATPAGQMIESGLRDVLGYQLALATVVTDAVFGHEVGEPHGLRPVEYTMLQLIAENAGASPVQLAKALSVTKPNITMWVDRLVGRGLVERTPHPGDGRAQQLRTTPKGAALAREATATLQQAERRAMNTLSVGERLLLAELLHKVACCALPSRK